MVAKGKQFFFPEDLPRSGKGSGLRNAIQGSGENMQQGWLFSPEEIKVSPKNYMTDEQRYPRGFNPRRQREVEHALRNTSITVDGRRFKDDPEFTQNGAPTKKGLNVINREVAAVKQVIARSKIPSEALNAVQINKIRTNTADLPDHTSGNFTPDMGGRINIGSMIDRGNNPNTNSGDASGTLIHEVGHAVDVGYGRRKGPKTATEKHLGGLARSYKDPNARPLKTDARGRGISEGIADSIEHHSYVPDKRAAMPPKQAISGYEHMTNIATRGGLIDRFKARSYIGKEYAKAGPFGRQRQGQQWAEGYQAGRSNEVRIGNKDVIKPPIQGELF